MLLAGWRCACREGEEVRRVEEVGRLQAQLAEERERAEQQQAVQRHELEGKVCDREARLRDITEVRQTGRQPGRAGRRGG